MTDTSTAASSVSVQRSLSVVLLRIGLGMRHATDADHVVVIAALVQRESGYWRAARIAALWGAGHA